MATADAFLLAALANGPRAASDLIVEARSVGISPRQLRRARERLCAPPEQAGRRWHWKLEEGGERSTPASVVGRDAMEPERSMEPRPGERQGPPPSAAPLLEPDQPMEGAIDWEDVGVQVPPAPAVCAMERDTVMEVPVAAAALKPQTTPSDHDVCQACGRWTCPDCLHEIPARRVAQHRAGVDPSRPECSRQDVRSIATQRDRPRSWSEQLFGVVAS